MFFKKEKASYLNILNRTGLPITNRDFWWVRYPERAIQELLLMKENTNANFYLIENQLIWKEGIWNNFGNKFFIAIKTDSKYPFSQPKAYILEPKIQSNFKEHIYKDGELCLMHPDSYNSQISILEIRNLVAAWCFSYTAYRQTGTWPAAEYKH